MAGITCPSCGGKMVFDIPQQNLKCPFCGTRKEVAEYKENNEADVQKETFNTAVYTCRNCGAELVAPDEQTVAYCSYCGSEAMLSAKYEDVIRPKKIIPFIKSKKQAKNEYEAALKGKLYVPGEFKKADFIEGFRGIYLPYYSYSAVVPEKEVTYKATKNYKKGSYDYREEYDVHAKLGGVTQDVKYDASIAFDDTIANEIAPFDKKNETDYSNAYLAGFYADKATTDIGTYIKYATEDATNAVYSEIEQKAGNVVLDKNEYKEGDNELGINSFNCDVCMYPIWFLTWRHKNRVAYSVMNGQSGKLSVDIPVDKKKFFLVSLIAAAAIFVILSLLPMFILPKTLSVISAILLFISGIILEKEIKRIYDREAHIYDYGDTTRTEKKKRIKAYDPASSKKNASKVGTGLGCLIVFLCYIGFYAIAGVVTLINAVVKGVSLSAMHTFIYIVAFLIQGFCSVLIIRYCLHLRRKTAILTSLFAPLTLFFGLWVGIYNPAHDYWFYGAALACLVAMVLNGLSAINYFNYLTTRPVPNFFRREGAENGEE